MKITVDINEKLDDTEITIHCKQITLNIENIIATLQMMNQQMVATSINVPVMMVLSFLPMLSMFNDTIKSFSKYIFSEQLYLLVNNLENIKISAETGIIMACNILAISFLFWLAYKKVFCNK
ncbi:MAG: hypothetical protein PUC55_00355 [Lachnospiraceae bacterium]|nr:hypothetical protein [Lachnospiraceae bacterium]